MFSRVKIFLAKLKSEFSQRLTERERIALAAVVLITLTWFVGLLFPTLIGTIGILALQPGLYLFLIPTVIIAILGASLVSMLLLFFAASVIYRTFSGLVRGFSEASGKMEISPELQETTRLDLSTKPSSQADILNALNHDSNSTFSINKNNDSNMEKKEQGFSSYLSPFKFLTLVNGCVQSLKGAFGGRRTVDTNQGSETQLLVPKNH